MSSIPLAPSGWNSQQAQIPELLAALSRIHSEAVILAEKAYEAIQHHSFDPYREYCEKRKEHAALVSVLRSRIGAKPQDPNWLVTLGRDERSLIVLSIQACLKFAFALSANPLMPLGARETFYGELDMLKAARESLGPAKGEDGIDDVLNEIDTALMVLEEIVERAPALEEF